jgi:hypothetical protein
MPELTLAINVLSSKNEIVLPRLSAQTPYKGWGILHEKSIEKNTRDKNPTIVKVKCFISPLYYTNNKKSTKIRRIYQKIHQHGIR